MKFTSFKIWLVEKFTDDDVDPIKSMGIGAKIVYYELKPYIMSITGKIQEDYYDMILTGDTFDIKDKIKHFGFKWSSIHKGWKSKSPRTMIYWQKLAEQLFKEIETKTGYVIEKYKNPDNADTPTIKGWGISEYPNIDDGTGQKVYISLKGEHWPIVLLMGKGTYTAREFLKYFKFRFDKDQHGWVKNSYNKNEIDEIVNYMKQHNYEIIDYRKGR